VLSGCQGCWRDEPQDYANVHQRIPGITRLAAFSRAHVIFDPSFVMLELHIVPLVKPEHC